MVLKVFYREENEAELKEILEEKHIVDSQPNFADEKSSFNLLGKIENTVSSSEEPKENFQANDDIVGAAVYQYGDNIVVLPTVCFSALSVYYAWYKFKKPVLLLLKDNMQTASKTPNHRIEKSSELSFVEYLKRNTLKSKKALVFFIIFASFCFSAMTQMSFSMKDLSSEMMGVMMLVIGLVLAFTTLFLAITTVINGNTKTIAMMRVFGYSQKECCRAILGGYRPLSYIGFIIGTVYQYGLLRLMVDIVFKDVEGVPTYKFDFPTMLISLACFITIYEIMMYIYSEKIKKISIKEIMIE